MSDGSSPPESGLSGRVYAWVSEVYGALAWTMSATGPQPEPTYAEAMLERIRDPRSEDLRVPQGATPDEARQIDDAYDEVVDALEQHGFSQNLAEAERRLAAIWTMVAEVPRRIERERRAALDRAAGLIVAPAGVTEAEREALAGAVGELQGRIATAAPSQFGALEAEVAALAKRPGELALSVAERGNAAAALRQRLALCKPPEGCLPGEAADVSDRAKALADGLTEPYSEVALKAGADGAGALEADIGALTERVRARGETARLLIERLGGCRPPTGCVPTEATDILDRAKTLTGKLSEPYSDEALTAVSEGAEALEEAIAKLAARVAARADAARQLLERLGQCQPPAGCLPDEATDIADRAKALAGRLTAPYSDEALAEVAEAAGALEDAVTKLAARVLARAEEARLLIERFGKCQPPPGCLPVEATDIADRAKALAGALTAPHSDASLKGAADGAAALEKDIQLLTAKVAQRGQGAADQKVRLAAITPPAGANPAEQSALGNGVATAGALLVEPYADLALDDVEARIVALGNDVKAIAQAIDARGQKRKLMADRLGKLVLPAGATAAETKAFFTARGDCGKDAEAANDDPALGAAEDKITALEKRVAEQAVLFTARGQALAAIAGARATLKAEGNTVDQGFQTVVAKAIADAQTALAKAADKGAIDTLRATLAAALAKLPDAKAYSADFDAWVLQTDFYLKCSVDPVDLPAVTAARGAARKAAEAKARACDYVAARAELAKFATEPKVKGADFAAAEAYRVKLLAFQSANDASLTLIDKSKVEGGAGVLAAVDAARRLATVGRDFAAAGAALDALATPIKDLAKVAPLWRKFSPLVKSNTPPTDPVKMALDQARGELGAQDYATALATLTGIEGSHGGIAAANLRHNALVNEAGTLGTRIDDALKTWVKATLVTARTKITANDLPGANTDMDTARGRMDAVADWVDVNNRVKALEAEVDQPKALGLLVAADAKVAARQFGPAKAELLTAETNMAAVARYRDLRARAAALQAALPPGTEPRKQADAALTEAGKLFDPDKKFADAVARLQQLFALPSLEAQALEIEIWQGRLAATAGRQARVVGLMDLVKPKDALADGLAAARAKAETDHKYPEAVALLDTHDAVVEAARVYTATRRQMLTAKKALDRAAAKFPAKVADIYAGMGRVDLEKALADCEKDAADAKFAEATAAYKALIIKCRDMAGNAAKLYEAADGVDSNAGHSLHRHGPEVTDEGLLTRLQTGLAPDNKTSFCSASSKFESPAAWLAGREQAAAEAMAQGVDIDSAKLAVPPPEPVSKMALTIDHGGPIDKAFEGVKSNVGIQGDGSIGPLDSYETYVEKSGITKSYTLFLFEIDSPDATPARPKTPKDYLARFKAMREAANLKAQQDATAAGLPAPAPLPLVPAEIPGRWVMMQHFPLVAGWDQEKGDYV